MIHAVIEALCVLVLGAAVVYLLVTWVAAKNDVAVTPKTKMFLCDVHGPIPESLTVTLFDGDMDQIVDGKTIRGPVRSCPICLESKIKLAGGRK